MNYIAFSLLAAFCFAISQVLSKLLSKHSIESKDSLMFYFMISSGTFAVFLLPFVSITLPSFEIIKLFLPTVGLFLLGYYFFFTGIFDADASSIAPLFQLQSAFVVLLAYILKIEQSSPMNYIWMAMMIFGAVGVSYHDKMTVKTFLSKGIVFILLMQVCHAFSNILINKVLPLTHPVQFLFWEDLLIGVLAGVFWLVKKPKLKYNFSQVAPMFASSYVVGVGVISLLSAYAQNLTVSSVIGLLSSPIVFLISILASRFSPQLLEHHTAKVYIIRALGLIIILIGAIKISLS